MSSEEDDASGFPFDIDEVMAAKRDNPGMFVSAWEKDENDIDAWTKSEIKADPKKQFIVAAEKGDLARLKYLAEQTKQPEATISLTELLLAKDHDGYSALHRATYEGHVHVVEHLIRLGADVHSRTEEDWTPLHSAAFWNQLACVQLLLSAGADLNAVTKSKQTALHLAVSNNQTPETLFFLLSQPGVKVHECPNHLGDTVADLMRKNTPFSDLCFAFGKDVTRLG